MFYAYCSICRLTSAEQYGYYDWLKNLYEHLDPPLDALKEPSNSSFSQVRQRTSHRIQDMLIRLARTRTNTYIHTRIHMYKHTQHTYIFILLFKFIIYTYIYNIYVYVSVCVLVS